MDPPPTFDGQDLGWGWLRYGLVVVVVPLVAHFAHSFQDEAGGRLSPSAGMQVVEEEEEEVEKRTYTAHSLSLESTCPSWEAQTNFCHKYLMTDKASSDYEWLTLVCQTKIWNYVATII